MPFVPEAGARCGNTARRDLCGGPPARAVPTATGRFCRSELTRNLGQINHYLLRWAQKKYKRLRGSKRRVWAWLEAVARREPLLFVHWKAGARP